MTHRLTTNYAKNYCNRTLIVKVIVENVVTFFWGHGVLTLLNGEVFLVYGRFPDGHFPGRYVSRKDFVNGMPNV